MQVQNKLSVFESLASGKQNGDLGLNLADPEDAKQDMPSSATLRAQEKV